MQGDAVVERGFQGRKRGHSGARRCRKTKGGDVCRIGPDTSISGLVAIRSATCTKPRKKLLSRKKNLKHF